MAGGGDNRVLVAFASGSEDLIPTLIERLKELEPELPLYVVSEFAPPEGRWIPYHPARSLRENYARVRAALRGRRVRFSGIILQPRMPYWRLRLIGLLISPAGFIAYNENLDHFMLRPRSAWTIARHCWWRTGNFFRWQRRPGGHAYTFVWRLCHPWALSPAAAVSGRDGGRMADGAGQVDAAADAAGARGRADVRGHLGRGAVAKRKAPAGHAAARAAAGAERDPVGDPGGGQRIRRRDRRVVSGRSDTNRIPNRWPSPKRPTAELRARAFRGCAC